MSLQDLAGLAGIPGLEPAVAALFRFYESIENIKVYKTQCKQLHAHCVELLLALRHHDESLYGTEYQKAIDQADHNFQHIARKVDVWSKYGSAKSWTRQSEIKQGIDQLNRDLVQCATRLNMISHMESLRKSVEMGKVMDQRHAELEERLHQLLESTKDLRQLLARPETEIAGHMLSIQQAIHEDTAGPEALQSLQERFLDIHRNTEILPPLIDLTGEVRRISDDPNISGGFSDVYLGEWLGNEKVALKMTRGINQTPNAQRRFMNEVAIWRKLQHHNVERLYGIATLGNHIYTVSPWMEHRDALRYIKSNSNVDRLKILVEAATGLEFLHGHRVVHGDLRAANILISDAGVACITDFGLSIILEEEAVDESSSNSTIDLPGNSRWMAPELINPELIGSQSVKRNPETDVWSYGMLCLEILTGQRPFHNRPHGPAVISDLMNGVRPTRPSAEATRHGLSDALWELMQHCWHQKPQFRPTMIKIVPQMHVFQAGQVRGSPVKHSRSFLVPKPEISTVPEEPIVPSESPIAITPSTGSNHLTPTSPPSAPNAQQPSVSGSHPRIEQDAQVVASAPHSHSRPSNSATHVRSASMHITSSQGMQPRVSARPSTAPQIGASAPSRTVEAGANAPQLPEIYEINNDSSRESFADILSCLEGDFTSPMAIPAVRVSKPSTPEELAISASLPTSFVLSAGHALRRPGEDVALSEGSGVTSNSSGLTSPGSEFSPTSSASLEPPVQRDVYIKSRRDGSIEAANLPGLVERLILDSGDHRMDIRFRETFLTTYQAFTDAETVFSLLIERFEAVSSPGTHSAEQRTGVRYSVIAVISLWLRGHHVEFKDVPLLHRMRQFALSIQSPTAAPTLKESASKLSQLIDKTIKSIVRPVSSRPSSSSSARSVGRPSEMTPEAFAAALTELESTQFKNIIASDCIGWIKGIKESNGVSNFVAKNDKISYWVQWQILRFDGQFQRSENLKYFLHVAEECRKLRNFSSTFSLVAGLAASSVTSLKRTSALEGRELRKIFQDLTKLTSSDGNSQAYRQALKACKDPCIPSLSVHLRDFAVVHGSQRTFLDEHKKVINFELYQRVYEHIGHILRYQDPPPKPPIGHRHLDIQAFIENQLHSLTINEAFHTQLQERGSKLAQEELESFAAYRDELRAAGFRR